MLMILLLAIVFAIFIELCEPLERFEPLLDVLLLLTDFFERLRFLPCVVFSRAK